MPCVLRMEDENRTSDKQENVATPWSWSISMASRWLIIACKADDGGDALGFHVFPCVIQRLVPAGHTVEEKLSCFRPRHPHFAKHLTRHVVHPAFSG